MVIERLVDRVWLSLFKQLLESVLGLGRAHLLPLPLPLHFWSFLHAFQIWIPKFTLS
jgi:hypothetical protein